jgi:hypothetical protein
MTNHHDAARLHRDDLEREIEAIRLERLLAAESATPSLVERARRRTGLALMSAGRTLAGPEARPLKMFDA